MVEGVSIIGKSINGCVFFICTAGLAGGSGRTEIRAVSFFGAGVVLGAGMAAAAPRVGEGESAGAGGGLVGGRVGK